MTANRRQSWLQISGMVVLTVAMAVMPSPRLHGAATIVIQNNDAAGVGFNDATPAAPVGGNPGTTLGQQRLNVFQAAANVWGATVTSASTIVIRAQWSALSCNATGAVLGSAGATEIFRDFTGALQPTTWYPHALASKLFGANLDPATPAINANFNVNLGQAGCLTGIFFYLGLDTNHGNNVDLMTVVLHEFSHGLGFQTFTSGTTGAFIAGFPSIYDSFAVDVNSGLTWRNMTASERVASAINTRRLAWNGANVTGAVPTVLQAGTPELQVTAPASVAATYLVGTAAFGPVLPAGGLTGEVMPVVAQAGDGGGSGCAAFSAVNALAVTGKVALIDRGVCGFTVKVKNAQNAGATGVIITNNAAGSPPPGMAGADPTITIPSVMITQADGNTLRTSLATRSRTHSGMFATMLTNLAVRLGADPLGRMLLYTPNPFVSGSSVSHWDTSAMPNQLMEPNINGDLTHSVTTPQDLTFALLRDIGWN